jgi:hypothetical protein
VEAERKGMGWKLVTAALAFMVACGARTSLIGGNAEPSDGSARADGREAPDAFTSGADASASEGGPEGHDSSSFPSFDSGVEDASTSRDGGSDAGSGPESGTTDAGPCVTASDCESLLGPTDDTCMTCPGGVSGCAVLEHEVRCRGFD